MKFGEQLKENLVPEWASQYMEYDQLKIIIDSMTSNQNDNISLQRLAEHFEFIFNQNLHKVQDFYSTVLIKQEGLVQDLFFQVQLIAGTKNSQKYSHTISQNCQELFKSLNMVQSYGSLNAIGFRKIYKKYKKNSNIALNINIDQVLLTSRINDNSLIDAAQTKLQIAFMHLHSLPDIKTARKLLQNYQLSSQNITKIRNKTSIQFGFVLGVSIIFFMCYIDIQLFEGTQYDMPDISNLILRFYLILFVLIFGLATMISIFEYKKINYIFIMELPASKVTNGYRKTYYLAFVVLFFVSLIGIFSTTTSVTQNSYKVPLPFSQAILFIADQLSAIYWVAFPFYFLFLYQLYQLVRIQTGHSQIARFVFIINYKLLTPWLHRVTFPLFFIADIFTSMTGVISDFIQIVSLQYAPDYLVFVGINIPNVIRIIQQVRRFIDTKLFYPHIVNLMKYLISIPSNLIVIEIISSNKPAYWIIICIKLFETIFKLYWDIFEDFSCFSGGTGGRAFKQSPEKWKNKIILRRPSSFQVYQVVLILLFDIITRFTWVIPVFYDSPDTSHVWYGIWVQSVEIIRRFIWGLLRLDNQQATNCEDLLATRYVPVLLSMNERMEMKVAAQFQQNQQEDCARLTRVDTMNITDEMVNTTRQSRISQQIQHE
ncbi:EXS family protein [Spironucleus salmonicida]|uniref:EXS family protein n=1 Tax=Spironucleus salmonicida TaxID=348837 RepID=V6LHW6_9EUKA|nr:EXS family protein [Spironucleus salmonicida]|eukprot:EST43903.1 EXS family protein [Spironucleus salmonicida]